MLTLMSLIVVVNIIVLAEKLPKMAILRDKFKDFEKTEWDEAMKWYFSHSPGQEE